MHSHGRDSAALTGRGWRGMSDKQSFQALGDLMLDRVSRARGNHEKPCNVEQASKNMNLQGFVSQVLFTTPQSQDVQKGIPSCLWWRLCRGSPWHCKLLRNPLRIGLLRSLLMHPRTDSQSGRTECTGESQWQFPVIPAIKGGCGGMMAAIH